MHRSCLIIIFSFFSLFSLAQEKPFDAFLCDSTMKYASVSFSVIDADSGNVIFEYQPQKSLMPASVMKLVTTAAAIELLGPGYQFSTQTGYRGSLSRSGRLRGDLIIKGGGDPALGSKYFTDHYQDFISTWIDDIRKTGIREIRGRVIADDSYYDYQPVPSKWLWEDMGNYYGAGTYGLSAFDNTFEIHFRTAGANSVPAITSIVPADSRIVLSEMVIAAGTLDEGYVFSAPYSRSGWITGTIPENSDDFVLKASVTDPPLLLAEVVRRRLEEAGIKISGTASTIRSEKEIPAVNFITVSKTVSPPLSSIIEVLNHQSVNLFAEHLIKELGKNIKDEGSTSAGQDVIMNFLHQAGVDTSGMFVEDGSGLSPVNAINASGLTSLLFYMRNRSGHFPEYFSSLADAGREGTLKNCFRDPVFENRLHAKSGSMTRVRSYAGYFTTASGKNMIFAIIVNNYTGPSRKVVEGIERIIGNLILNN